MIYDFELENEPLGQADLFRNLEFSCDRSLRPAVLLTPECDIVVQEGRSNPKAQFFLFGGVESFKPILYDLMSQLRITKKQRSGDEALDRSTFDDLQAALRRFFNGAIYPRYFYLPAVPEFLPHSVIDFQITETRKVTQALVEDLKSMRIAKIRSSWKEAIPVRFSSYSSRVGVQDLTDYYIDQVFSSFGLEFSITSE